MRDTFVDSLPDIQGLLVPHPGEEENPKLALPEILLQLSTQTVGMSTLDQLLTTLTGMLSIQIGAERSSLFLNDVRTNELYSPFAQGAWKQWLRFSNSTGITGHVYLTGKSMIVHDAYSHPRFNRSKDQQTGYVTRNIMCAPIRTSRGELIGVLCVLNKIVGQFTDHDLAFLEAMTAQVTFILSTIQLFEGMKRSHAKEAEMIDAISETGMELDLDVCLRKVMSNAERLLQTERVTLFLHDKEPDELFSRVLRDDAINEIRFSSGRGIAGHVFTTGKTINIPDAHVDSRFNPEFDQETGFVTRSVLCAPVINKRGEVIGVSQALNKKTGPFTYENESRLKAFTAEISSVLENAQLFSTIENMGEGKQGTTEIMSDGVITFDTQGNIMTCNTSGLKIMCTTLKDILHRPAHEVFTGPNVWVVEKLEHVARTHAVDMAADSTLEFGGNTQMVNMTLLPLVDAAKSEVGSMVVFKTISQ